MVDLDGDAGDPYLQALSFVALGVPRVCKTSIYLKFRLLGIPHLPPCQEDFCEKLQIIEFI